MEHCCWHHWDLIPLVASPVTDTAYKSTTSWGVCEFKWRQGNCTSTILGLVSACAWVDLCQFSMLWSNTQIFDWNLTKAGINWNVAWVTQPICENMDESMSCVLIVLQKDSESADSAQVLKKIRNHSYSKFLVGKTSSHACHVRISHVSQLSFMLSSIHG